MKKLTLVGLIIFAFSFVGADTDGCDGKPTSDDIQRQQQERVLQEGTSQIGMPAIKNFRERKLLKDILELRDQANFPTYTYLWSDLQGRWVFFCNSIGYGIPYATQFTNPQKVVQSLCGLVRDAATGGSERVVFAGRSRRHLGDVQGPRRARCEAGLHRTSVYRVTVRTIGTGIGN